MSFNPYEPGTPDFWQWERVADQRESGGMMARTLLAIAAGLVLVGVIIGAVIF